VQIAESIVNKKGAKKRQKRLWSKVHPTDIPYWKILLSAMFGFTGAHCFVTKRWIRGAFILGSVLLMFICFFVFPIDVSSEAAEAAEMVLAHPARYMFDEYGLMFPPDILGVVAIGLWLWDWIAILFGFYKYPVFVDLDAQKNAQVDNAGKKY
jgi:hypothetical protein